MMIRSLVPFLALFLLLLPSSSHASLHKLMMAMVDGEMKSVHWIDQHTKPESKHKFHVNTTIPMLDITEEINYLYTAYDAERNIDPYDQGPTLLANVTYLHIAAMRGFSILAQRLISLGADVNAAQTAMNGRLNLVHVTPIHLAALFGPENTQIIDVLSDAGADLVAETKDRHITPIMLAIDNGHEPIFHRLLTLMDIEAYLSGNRPHNATAPVTLASETVDGEDKPVLQQMQREDLIPIQLARQEATQNWLHLAAIHGQVGIAEALLDHPILRLDPNARSHGGRGDTALAAACQTGQLAMVRYLVTRYGGDALRDPSQDGLTPWQLAKNSGKLAVIRWLQEWAKLHGDVDLDASRPNSLSELPPGITEEEAPTVTPEMIEILKNKQATPATVVTNAPSSEEATNKHYPTSETTSSATSAETAASEQTPASTSTATGASTSPQKDEL